MIKMYLIILLSTIFVVEAGVIQYNVIINGIPYQREILYENATAKLLACDYDTDILYLYANDHIARLDLNTKVIEDLIRSNIELATLAVDWDTHVLYVGTKGIYKYNTSTNKHKLIAFENYSILNMYFKDVLYFIRSQSNFVYKLENTKSSVYLELASQPYNFVIDNENNIFYINDIGLIKKNGTNEVLYKEAPRITNSSLTIDRNDRVYYCAFNGIYEVSKDTPVVKKVIPIDEPIAMTFDKDNNIIYSDGTNIYRFKPILETEKNATNTTNSCSDRYDQELGDHIKMQLLESIVEKIDALTRKVEKMQTVNNITILNIMEERHHSESTPGTTLNESKGA